MLGERNRLLQRDEHVHHAMLQHLKRAQSDAELLARLAVFQRRRIQFCHGTDRLRAQRCNSAVATGLQSGDALAFGAQHLARRHLHVH